MLNQFIFPLSKVIKKEVKNTDIFYCTADCLCFLVPVNKIERRMSQENIMNLEIFASMQSLDSIDRKNKTAKSNQPCLCKMADIRNPLIFRERLIAHMQTISLSAIAVVASLSCKCIHCRGRLLLGK